MSAPHRRRLAVLGAGPGGYAAAFRAAELGLEVHLVEPEPALGGVCLHRGCIPSKALLHTAKLLDEARNLRGRGVPVETGPVDVARLRAWLVDDVMAPLARGLAEKAARLRVTLHRARARFGSARTLDLQGVDGTVQRLEVDATIIATGSRPVGLPGAPASARVWDSSRALELPAIPERLLVVGAGYIGLELGSAYAALGSRVTLVELADAWLPGVDADLVRVLRRSLQPRFEAVHLGCRAALEEAGTGRLLARLAPVAPGADELRVEVDAALVAIGRRPQTEDLGLDHTAVHRDASGFLRVDATLRTDDPAIWAIGDVVGQPMLAHKATHEARVAAESVAGHVARFEPRAVPAVVFTDPQVAWCGLQAHEARATGRDVQVARLPWGANGRARTLGHAAGLTKLVLDAGTRRLLGAGLVGPDAGDLIAECALAVELGATADDLAFTIHAHPTLSETVMDAAATVRDADPVAVPSVAGLEDP